MLNATSIGTKTTLATAITSNGLTLRVPSGMGQALDPGTGNHFWLTIRSGSSIERVKVIGRSGDLLTLEGRGGDGTTARQWPAGACLEVEWNPAQLCEFIQNCMAGAASPTGVTPQTICMASCACIDVGADGRITKISGGQSC
jgi:hypothetical protein